MPARDDILAYEQKQLVKRYDRALVELVRMVQTPHYDVTELICRLLTSRVLPCAAGALMEHGYRDSYFYGPLYRMEWVVHFVGHEILDDGEPALCFHRYAWHGLPLEERVHYAGDVSDMVDCKRDDPGAKPYWHRYWEIAPEGKEHLNTEKALWTLDWYEDHEERRYNEIIPRRKRATGRGDEEPEKREPEDTLMLALATELRKLPKEKA